MPSITSILMYKFTEAAKTAFSKNQPFFKANDRNFIIMHQHDNEYAVMADGVEIIRIVGNTHKFEVMEV